MDGQIGDVDAAVCGFCKHGEEACCICGQLHHERSTNSMIAAHQKCMQYSSGLEQYKFDHFGGFHIDNVEKEIKRGRQLKCSLCRLGGATCGCSKRSCKKTFHFHCVFESDQAVNKRFRVDSRNKSVILYRVYCSVAHKEEDKRTITADEIDVLLNDSDSSNKDEPARKKKSPKKSKKSNSRHCPAYFQSQDSPDDDNYSIEIETTVEDEGVPEILHEDAAFSSNTSRMDATAESINKNGHADSIHDGFNSDSSRLSSQTLTQESPAADNIEDINKDLALQSGTPRKQASNKSTSDEAVDLSNTLMNKGRKESPKKVDDSPFTKMKSISSVKRSSSRLSSQTLTQESPAADNIEDLNRDVALQSDTDASPVIITDDSDTTDQSCASDGEIDLLPNDSDSSNKDEPARENTSPNKSKKNNTWNCPDYFQSEDSDSSNKDEPARENTSPKKTGEIDVLPNDSDSSNKDEPARENTSPKKTVRRDRRDWRKLTASLKELVQYSLEAPPSGSRNKRKRNEEDLASEQTTPVKSAKQQKTGKVSATATISDTTTPVKVNTVAVDGHNKQSKPSSQLTTGSRNNSPSKVSEIVSLTKATISDTTTPVKVKTVAVDGHNKQSKTSSQLTTGSRNNSPNSSSMSTEDSEDVVELNDILPVSSAKDQGSLSSASSEEQKLRLQSLKLDILERERKLLDLKIGYWQKKREQEDL